MKPIRKLDIPLDIIRKDIAEISSIYTGGQPEAIKTIQFPVKVLIDPDTLVMLDCISLVFKKAEFLVLKIYGYGNIPLGRIRQSIRESCGTNFRGGVFILLRGFIDSPLVARSCEYNFCIEHFSARIVPQRGVLPEPT
ncbi:hypothetical protein TNCV_4694501 [Trichonephila clavipes]|nr:hypothetical protein TNCV_4694501 [Trichonephila clavipes]